MDLVGAHVEITVPDLESEIAFYREHFEGRVVARDNNEWALVRCGPYDIALRRGKPLESRTFHLGFRLPSRETCEAAFDALRRAAVVKGYEDHDGWGNLLSRIRPGTTCRSTGSPRGGGSGMGRLFSSSSRDRREVLPVAVPSRVDR